MIVVEYTSPRTPQQNGLVERAFAVIYSTIRAMYQEEGILKALHENTKNKGLNLNSKNNW